ncbi:hypothetical protein [Povalibacter sp.]|uniref:hypothetical protein n=1 Tax=Povalibacter sp. TaxID=1962978 RepID=UPI002F40F8A8
MDGRTLAGHCAAAAFDWSLTDSTTLLLDVEHIRKNIAEPAAIALPAAVGGRITLPTVPPSTRNLADDWHRYDAVATNAVGRLSTTWSNTIATIVEFSSKAATASRRSGWGA